MFADPYTAIMALILLAFIGTLAVFLRIWRELDSLRIKLNELQNAMQLFFEDTADQQRQLANISRDIRKLSGNKDGSAPHAEESLGALLDKGLPNITGGLENIKFQPASLGKNVQSHVTAAANVELMHSLGITSRGDTEDKS